MVKILYFCRQSITIIYIESTQPIILLCQNLHIRTEAPACFEALVHLGGDVPRKAIGTSFCVCMPNVNSNVLFLSATLRIAHRPAREHSTYSFSKCTSLVSITLPQNLTSIGAYAFYRGSSLVSITLPQSLSSIGASAFRECTSLVSITLPQNLTSIGAYSFSKCTSLVSITLPQNLTSIGDGAFRKCTSLVGIMFPHSLTGIGMHAFDRCTSLVNVTFPQSSLSNRR